MIGRNALIQIIFTAVSSLVGFLTLSLSARFFGPGILGQLAYILGITGTIFAFSDLGFSQAHVHFTAALSSAQKTLGTFLRLKLVLLGVTGAVALLVNWLSPNQFKGVLMIVLLYEMFSRFSEAIFITFEGLQQSIPQNVSRLIAKAFKLAAVIVLGLKLGDVLGYSLTFLVEAVVLLILGCWLIRRYLPLIFSSKLAKKYLGYSLPFFAIIPLSYLQTNSITILLKFFRGASEVGFYAVSANLTGYVKDLFGAVMIFFFPKISSLFQKQGVGSIQKYADLSLKYLLTLFTPVFMVAFLLRREIVLLVLGQKFLPAVPAFSLLLLGMLILMLVNPYSYILYATRKHQLLVKVNLIGLALTLVLSFYFMRFGAAGAALISVLVWSITGIWTLVLLKKQLRIRFFPKLLHYLLPAILLVILTESIFTNFSFNLFTKAGLSVLTVFTYLVYLLMFKLIQPSDLEYFFSLIWKKH